MVCNQWSKILPDTQFPKEKRIVRSFIFGYFQQKVMTILGKQELFWKICFRHFFISRFSVVVQNFRKKTNEQVTDGWLVQQPRIHRTSHTRGPKISENIIPKKTNYLNKSAAKIWVIWALFWRYANMYAKIINNQNSKMISNIYWDSEVVGSGLV